MSIQVFRDNTVFINEVFATVIQPIFVSDKIQRELKVHEIKPPIVNQEHVIYKFQCDLCDASYVGYTLRYLHQCVAEHTKQSSSIGKHFIVLDVYSVQPVLNGHLAVS